MSKQKPVNPFFKEGDKVTSKLEEGVTIKLEPAEFDAIDAIIRENQATMHAIKELSRELVEQEGRMWKTIHSFYPDLEKHHCQFNFRDGIVIVGGLVKPAQQDFIDTYGYVAPPFTLRAERIEGAEMNDQVPDPVKAMFAKLFGETDSDNDEED